LAKHPNVGRYVQIVTGPRNARQFREDFHVPSLRAAQVAVERNPVFVEERFEVDDVPVSQEREFDIQTLNGGRKMW
jgi:hypothetical protein